MVCCAHADWPRAFAFHPLGPVAYAGLVFWAVFAAWRLARSGTSGPFTVPATWCKPVGWTLGAAAAVVWTVRMLGILPTAP